MGEKVQPRVYIPVRLSQGGAAELTRIAEEFDIRLPNGKPNRSEVIRRALRDGLPELERKLIREKAQR